MVLAGVDVIVHAGDVGRPEILSELKKIAPVFAVRGNVDRGDWATELPLTTVMELDGASFYILHDLHELHLKPEAAKFNFVISGHTHQPEQSEKHGVIYLNPGSAGPRRFCLPVTLAVLDLAKKPWRAKVIDLKVDSSRH